MLGVLLNLLLGLSRIVLAMGRRGDMPAIVAHIHPTASTPTVAVIVTGVIILGITAIGSIRLAWTFSAFTVLIYYALTNLAALKLAPEHRLYPRAFSHLGLLGCAFLAFWVNPEIWGIGLGVIVVGLAWHVVARKLARDS